MALLNRITLFLKSLSNPSLLKGGEGSGNHGHEGRKGKVGGSAPTIVLSEPSGNIQNLDEAQTYYRKHLAGKAFDLTVNRPSGQSKIRLIIDADNTHPYTHEAKNKESVDVLPDRAFDLRRARLLDKILPLIQRPFVLLGKNGRKLYISTNLSGAAGAGHYLVVLQPNNGNAFTLSSAYPVTAEELRKLREQLRPESPLMKKAESLRIRPQCPVFFQALGEAACQPRVLANPPVPTTSVTGEAGGMLPPIALFLKATPAGARWITVHPNGKDTKGTPVMVQETKHGSGVMHVIGGAGGKLNYLKLRGVKSEADYRKESVERSKAKRESAKEQKQKDKAAGTFQKKQSSRRDIREQKQGHEAEFVQTVARAMDWKSEDLAFPEHLYENVSELGRKKAGIKHHAALLKRANEAVEMQRQRLLLDADARSEAGIGEIPLETSSSTVLSVQDLDPICTPAGLGYSTDYKKRSESAGLTPEKLAAEKAELRERSNAEKSPEAVQAIERRVASAKAIRGELEAVRDPGMTPAPVKVLEARQAVDLLKAQKALKSVQKQARGANKAIDAGEEPKAFVLEVGGKALDESVQEDLANDLRTLKTRAFLSAVGKTSGDYEKTLGRHLGVGAYNSLNSLSLTATGAGLIDRDAVDVLGVGGAAQVLARRLHTDLTPSEITDLHHALESFHYDHYLSATNDALKEAQEWHDVANEIDVGSASNGHDLATAQELNLRRRDAINKANEVLGTALGEMEANAALLVALKQGKKDGVQVSMGNVSPESAIQQARAIGLQRGEYQIEAAGNNRFLSVTAAGMDRLAKPVNRDDMLRVKGALDIIEGRQDEDDWLPGGIARRPDLAMSTPPGAAPSLAERFNAGGDIEQSLKDYIGGRTADGDTPADIIADLLASDQVAQVGERRDSYFDALNKLAPVRDAKGKPLRAEAHQPAFEKMADDFVQNRYGGKRSPLHAQHVPVDQVSVDALHRALSAEPGGIAAYKPIGDMDHHDQRAMRDFFARNVAKDDPEAEDLRAELADHEKNQPEKESQDMFGDVSTNPDWTGWNSTRDEKQAALNNATLSWAKYVKAMGGNHKAYAAMQDMIRSKLASEFHKTYNTLRPDQPLKLGRTVIRNNLDHLDAVDKDARALRQAEQAELIDGLRDRVQGRYASGSVMEKLAATREQMEADAQSQMGFFGAMEEPEAKAKPLKQDERHTLGHATERQIAAMMPVVGQNFKPGQPTKLWSASMNGKFVKGQRAVKLIEHNKRVVLAMGTGSGKTVMQMGAFTHLHSQGKAKRALFVVPSIVQGQFSGEALRYLEAGKYKWHCEPGASLESRLAAYKDPDTHFSVVTHQSFRDDMLHLGAEAAGITSQEMTTRVASMSPADRKTWAKGVMDGAGMDHDYLAVDEGQDMLNRAGKENSGMANVVDGVAANTPYYVSASADPVKNDSSEIFDIMAKMDPDRYNDRASFMRRYGVNTPASKDGLRREMARHFYPGSVDAGVPVKRSVVPVTLSAGQNKALQEVDTAVASARLARIGGKVDVAAMKVLSPSSFEGSDAANHEAIAKGLQDNIGIIRDTATHRVINAHADNAKTDEISKMAGSRRGKPGVIFAHSLEAVKQISERLKKDGHRVVTLTGGDSSKEKESKKLAFHPESGEASADIFIASDAGAVGANLQRGSWLTQFDTPLTAKTHAQRQGRIHRLGQKNSVELLDLVADHPAERKARKRLADKYQLRDVMTSPLEGLDDTGLAGYLNQVKSAKEQGSGSLF